jgi:hypothetical protein
MTSQTSQRGQMTSPRFITMHDKRDQTSALTPRRSQPLALPPHESVDFNMLVHDMRLTYQSRIPRKEVI